MDGNADLRAAKLSRPCHLLSLPNEILVQVVAGTGNEYRNKRSLCLVGNRRLLANAMRVMYRRIWLRTTKRTILLLRTLIESPTLRQLVRLITVRYDMFCFDDNWGPSAFIFGDPGHPRAGIEVLPKVGSCAEWTRHFRLADRSHVTPFEKEMFKVCGLPGGPWNGWYRDWVHYAGTPGYRLVGGEPDWEESCTQSALAALLCLCEGLTSFSMPHPYDFERSSMFVLCLKRALRHPRYGTRVLPRLRKVSINAHEWFKRNLGEDSREHGLMIDPIVWDGANSWWIQGPKADGRFLFDLPALAALNLHLSRMPMNGDFNDQKPWGLQELSVRDFNWTPSDIVYALQRCKDSLLDFKLTVGCAAEIPDRDMQDMKIHGGESVLGHAIWSCRRNLRRLHLRICDPTWLMASFYTQRDIPYETYDGSEFPQYSSTQPEFRFLEQMTSLEELVLYTQVLGMDFENRPFDIKGCLPSSIKKLSLREDSLCHSLSNEAYVGRLLEFLGSIEAMCCSSKLPNLKRFIYDARVERDYPKSHVEVCVDHCGCPPAYDAKKAGRFDAITASFAQHGVVFEVYWNWPEPRDAIAGVTGLS